MDRIYLLLKTSLSDRAGGQADDGWHRQDERREDPGREPREPLVR